MSDQIIDDISTKGVVMTNIESGFGKYPFITRMGEAAMYEQLAEECCELAQAALKCARIIREDNPTPITMDEARDNLDEEFNDVMVCAYELDLSVDMSQVKYKINRFLDRWEERKNE